MGMQKRGHRPRFIGLHFFQSLQVLFLRGRRLRRDEGHVGLGDGDGEGLGLGVRGARGLEEHGVFPGVHGGGQFAAEALRIPVIAGPKEGTALGNALVQIRATGLVNSLEEMRAIVGRSIELKTYQLK